MRTRHVHIVVPERLDRVERADHSQVGVVVDRMAAGRAVRRRRGSKRALAGPLREPERVGILERIAARRHGHCARRHCCRFVVVELV